MTTLHEAATLLEQFSAGSLTGRISQIEAVLQGQDKQTLQAAGSDLALGSGLLDAALTLKKAAGQINVTVHALGILEALPHILQEAERIEYVSLGAGNTGRRFDLETNQRVAEFKFITWQGGAEVIRQNSVFKDFYWMAEYETTKVKYLYVLGTEYPLRFLSGGRALSSVLSRNNKLLTDFRGKCGNRFTVVRDYYEFRKSAVRLVDLARIVAELRAGRLQVEE